MRKKKTLNETHPALCSEWDYEKNGDLTPDQVTYGSKKKVWWKCEHGHSFQQSVLNRTRRRNAPDYIECPHCSHIVATPGEYSLATEYPGIAQEWDWEMNGDMDPDHVLPGSSKKVFWKCLQGHEWETTISSHTTGGTGCPFCAGLKAIPGEYTLTTEYPELLEEWDWDANTAEGIIPDDMHPHSYAKVHWVCPEGHKWVESIHNRTAGKVPNKCPQCHTRQNHSFKSGVNDVATMHPELVPEWSDRNKKSPSEVHSGSSQMIWWKCSKCGNEWETRVNHRTKDGHGCPYCSGLKNSVSTSLGILYPEIAKEWDYKINNVRFDGKTPYDFGAHTSAVAAWQCSVNPKHKYDMRIGHRTEGYGCPYCSHHKILPEESFAAEYPELLEEWDWEKNKDLDPWSLASGTDKTVWWKCSQGHEWKAAINDRARRGSKCAKCQPHGTSFAEQVFYFGAKKLFPEYEIENRYETSFGKEIDIYIHELSIGIEPGSWFWHEKHLERDVSKLQLCNEHGIELFVIYEDCPCEINPMGDKHYVFSKSFTLIKNGELFIRDIMKDIFGDYVLSESIWNDETWHEIARVARKRLISLGTNNERSLAVIAPELMTEWSPNNEFSPEQVYAKSNTPILWVCPKGHEYTMSPLKRVLNGYQCNVCSNHVADPRYNTISKLYPEFLFYLSPNNDVDPDTVTPACSTKALTWRCPECGHEFEMTPYRMFKGNHTRCPSCRKNTLFPHTPFSDLDY